MIVPMAKMRVLAQALQVHIGEEDLLRGFVDVECATHIEVRSNSRCRIVLKPSSAWFSLVHVYGFPRVIDIGAEGGAFVRPLQRQRSSVYQLSFRFELRSDTLPGTYRWPLALSLDGDWGEEAPPRPAGAEARFSRQPEHVQG